jgi:lysozyme
MTIETDKKAGLAATLLASALPYLGAFSFGEEAQAAQQSTPASSPNERTSLNQKDCADLSKATFSGTTTEKLPDGREITNQIDLRALPTLKMGAQGDWVKFLQNKLNEQGSNLAVDGKFGNKTETALKQFQTTHELKADGIVGPKTWQKILELDNAASRINLVTSPSPTATSLSYNKDLRAMLKLHEGIRDQIYLCSAGKCTIGVGHNLDANGTKAERSYFAENKASEAQIEKWLSEDIKTVTSGLDRTFGKERWFQELSPNRKMVMIDMGFNIGLDKLMDFEKCLSRMKASDFQGAAAEMLKSSWANQVGSRANRLADIMRSDKLPLIPNRFYQ